MRTCPSLSTLNAIGVVFDLLSCLTMKLYCERLSSRDMGRFESGLGALRKSRVEMTAREICLRGALTNVGCPTSLETPNVRTHRPCLS